jgi:hypothetical protein
MASMITVLTVQDEASWEVAFINPRHPTPDTRHPAPSTHNFKTHFACGINQLCAGLEAIIEGHPPCDAESLGTASAAAGKRLLGFLLIDAKNAFNEQSRTAMGCGLSDTTMSGRRGGRFFHCCRH